MQLFKRIGATALVVIIVFTLAAPCFSTPVAIEGIDIFTALYNSYLVARGMDAVGSSNDVPWSVSEPASSATWRDLWQQNFNYYAAQVDQTINDVDAWVTAYIDQLDAQVRDRLNPSDPPEDPNDNGVIGLQFTAQLTEFFDKFTNLIFKDKYNLTNDGSGFVHYSGSFDSPLSSVTYDMDSDFLKVSKSSSDRTVICSWNNTTRSVYAYSDADVWIAFTSINGAQASWVYCSNVNASVIQYNGNNYSTVILNFVSDGVYYSELGYGGNSQYNPLIPVFSSLSDALSVAKSYLVDGNSTSSLLSLSPSDRIGSSPIPVPDTDDVDYVPAPLDVPLNVPWTSTMDDPDFSDNTDPAADAIVDAITGEVATNTLSTLEPVTPDPPLASPSPVMPPFLPSEPPPFDFNFSGIWYYVVRWVNSMRSGMGWLMNIWSNIPAAMFYPVFGSAVVVIVLGVWRRFVA